MLPGHPTYQTRVSSWPWNSSDFLSQALSKLPGLEATRTYQPGKNGARQLLEKFKICNIKNISKLHRIPQTQGSFPDLRPGWHQCHHVVAIAKWCCSVPDGQWWLMTIWQGGSAVMAVMVMIAPAFDTAKWSGVHPVVSWDLTFQVTPGTVLPPLIWNPYNRYVKTREPMRV